VQTGPDSDECHGCSSSCLLQLVYERIRNEVRALYGRVLPHQADAPGFASKLAQASAEFDVMALQQLTPHSGVVDAVGNLHQRERCESMFRFDN